MILPVFVQDNVWNQLDIRGPYETKAFVRCLLKLHLLGGFVWGQELDVTVSFTILDAGFSMPFALLSVWSMSLSELDGALSDIVQYCFPFLVEDEQCDHSSP